MREKQWNELISSRKEFYEERHVGSEFWLWPEEEAFVQAQAERRSSGREPEAIPDELQNWQERAAEEVQHLIEEQARQREIMLQTLWKEFEQALQKYIDDRTVYQQEFQSEHGAYHLSRTEQMEIDLLKMQRDTGLPPKYPDWMEVDWQAKADMKRELLVKWKEADTRWENYLASRQAYQDEFYSGRKYELSSEEQWFVKQQELRRKHDEKPEIPEWMENWRKKADAVRQKEYEAESKWKWNWKNFDEKWNAYLGGREELSGFESAYQRIVEQRRRAHKLPPEYREFPNWMRTAEVQAVHQRQVATEEIRNKLGIRPGDEDCPVDARRKAYYESRKHELSEQIAEYDREVILEKLPEWMKERNPDSELKEKIRNGIYLKYRCHVEDEKSLSSMNWLDLQNRKLKAKAEYEKYEQCLLIPPATQEQIAELKEFVEAEYLDSYPEDLSMEDAEKMLKELREEEKRQALEDERRLHPVENWTHHTLEALYQAGRLKKLPEGICEREARELINEITEHDPANEFEKGQVRRAIRDGVLPYSVEKRLANLNKGEYRELLAQAREAREAAALEQARRERKHPRQVTRGRGGMER